MKVLRLHSKHHNDIEWHHYDEISVAPSHYILFDHAEKMRAEKNYIHVVNDVGAWTSNDINDLMVFEKFEGDGLGSSVPEKKIGKTSAG